ncbi:MAG: D-alanyl-D-alanine carboxypeptidase, partial [Phycisphaerales bacterium]|nr:D-alanyl-D-alanine carboxypeptidase [Phycisphaerales bacterium]
MRPLRYATRTAMLLPLLLAMAAVAGLQQDIERTIAEAGFTNREVSVAVRECGTDRLIAAVSASTPRMPASNQKLLTAGVAAMVLGADFSFQTRLVRRDDDLIVIGDGDPALGDDLLLKKMTLPDGTTLTATGLLDLWAASVANSGTRHVQTLIVDDRIFDRDWYPEEWPKNQLQRHYCA